MGALQILPNICVAGPAWQAGSFYPVESAQHSFLVYVLALPQQDWRLKPAVGAVAAEVDAAAANARRFCKAWSAASLASAMLRSCKASKRV